MRKSVWVQGGQKKERLGGGWARGYKLLKYSFHFPLCATGSSHFAPELNGQHDL